MTNTSFCPVCGSDDFEMRGAYRGTHQIFAGLKRAYCSLCGMVFAAPMPQESVLEEYNNSYFASAHGGQPMNTRSTAFFSGIARLRLSHLDRYLSKNNISVSSLLEFGPGSGFFARNFLEKHSETNYMAMGVNHGCWRE